VNRAEALKAIREKVKNENLVKHMIATEAIMRALAKRLGENEDEWALAGLLHDIDVEITNADLKVHSKPGSEMARQLGASEAVCHAILTHNEAHGVACVSMMDKALFCADPLTGLITAGALVRPDKKLAGLEAKSVLKRFKEKSFAAGANRENMGKCTEIGLDLDTFIELGVEAMKGVAGELGL
jgi:putative nucleotidyltransferase with HDIG domain